MNDMSSDGVSDSRDTVVLIIDGPWDSTRRPCDPKMLPILKAESEKIKRYEAMMKERQRQNGAQPPQKD